MRAKRLRCTATVVVLDGVVLQLVGVLGASEAVTSPVTETTATRLPAQALGTTPTATVTSTARAVEMSVPGRHGELPATLHLPATATRAAVPGVVLLAGSGSGRRVSLTPAATALAHRGVAVLTCDKDLTGYSAFARDCVALADDAAAAVAVLRDVDGVDARRVGVWGLSEGAWAAAQAAARDPSTAFVVSVSGPTVSPGEQLDCTVARFLHAHRLGGLRWLVTLQLALGEPLFTYTGHRPPLSEVSQPFLAVFGAEDPTVPVVTAASRLGEELPSAPALVVLAGAGHDLTESAAAAELVAGWSDAPGPFRLVQSPLDQGVTASGTRPVPGVIVVALHASNLLLLTGAGLTGLIAARGLRPRLTPEPRSL